MSAPAQQQSGQPMPMQGMDHMNMDHAAHMAAMAKAQRQAKVSELGKDVMPFDLSATLHVFTKDAEGGVQQVAARDKSDVKQTELARRHLKEIREQFLKGDFSGPTHIHGAQMPGLAELSAAKPGSIAIGYKDVKGGAELSFKTADPVLVAAIHKWFDAQVSDHGKDAMEGHVH
ncbi:MAG: aspartate carbamoyltransferase [Curvibacter sp.]|nr:MAG: aspartate carbamoyltransferase [Curvibacter sp.]